MAETREPGRRCRVRFVKTASGTSVNSGPVMTMHAGDECILLWLRSEQGGWWQSPPSSGLMWKNPSPTFFGPAQIFDADAVEVLEGPLCRIQNCDQPSAHMLVACYWPSGRVAHDTVCAEHVVDHDISLTIDARFDHTTVMQVPLADLHGPWHDPDRDGYCYDCDKPFPCPTSMLIYETVKFALEGIASNRRRAHGPKRARAGRARAWSAEQAPRSGTAEMRQATMAAGWVTRCMACGCYAFTTWAKRPPRDLAAQCHCPSRTAEPIHWLEEGEPFPEQYSGTSCMWS
jgi:hypothetical protein